MRIERIKDKTTFGIYKGTQKTYYGKIDSGVYKDKTIDIYTAYNQDGTLKHKLYYITDKANKWLKSKLKFFKNNKCYYIAKGSNRLC